MHAQDKSMLTLLVKILESGYKGKKINIPFKVNSHRAYFTDLYKTKATVCIIRWTKAVGLKSRNSRRSKTTIVQE